MCHIRYAHINMGMHIICLRRAERPTLLWQPSCVKEIENFQLRAIYQVYLVAILILYNTVPGSKKCL